MGRKEPLLHALRKQANPFLRAGRAEVEGFTRKWAEVFIIAVGIGVLDAGDTLGVVAAKNELLNRLGDPLDTESAVDDSVFAFISFRDALKMFFK